MDLLGPELAGDTDPLFSDEAAFIIFVPVKGGTGTVRGARLNISTAVNKKMSGLLVRQIRTAAVREGAGQFEDFRGLGPASVDEVVPKVPAVAT